MRKAIPILVFAALLLGACAGTAPAAAQRTIVVTGTGTVSVKPDIAIVSLGVQTQGPDVGEAVQENNRRAQAVIDALGKQGVASADLRTTNFSVSSLPQIDPMGVATGVTLYTIDNTILFTLRATEKLGAALQAALQAGSNSVQSVSYSVSDMNVPMDEARGKAVADAQRQAEQISAGAGASLGKVLTIGESAGPAPMYYAVPAFGKGGGGGGVPVEAGTLNFQAQVTLTYELK